MRWLLLPGKPDQSLKAIVQIASAELWGCLSRKPHALALLMRDERGSWQAGIAGDVPEWSIFPLVSFYQDAVAAGKSIHLVDHLADNIRSLGMSIRRSAIAPCLGLPPVAITQEAAIWVGVGEAEVLDEAILSTISEFRRAFTEWILDSSNILSTLRKVSYLERQGMDRERTLSLVAHDLKAPLAAMRWQLTDFGRGTGRVEVSAQQLTEELSYMEGLLTTLVNKERSLSSSVPADISLGEMLTRVLERFKAEADKKGIRSFQVSDVTVTAKEIKYTNDRR